jgi:uncharacterized membrane protein YphA (DoxX/SURF4 family)
VIERIESHLTRVCESYAPNRYFLAALRIVFGVWIIAFSTDISWIAEVPSDFVNPRPGLFAFITGVPSAGLLTAIMTAKLVLGVMVAIGFWTLPASVALTACMMVASGITYSFSKIDHFELAPVFLALAGWGGAWSVDAFLGRRAGKPRRPIHGLPVLLYGMTIAWGMLSAAAPKAANGWLDPSRHATRGYLVRDIALGEKIGPLGEQLLSINSGLFWNFLDYMTIIAEGGLILVVFFPLMFRLWLVMIIAFHVGVYLALGINFSDNLLAYAVFFSPVAVFAGNKVSIVVRGRGGQRGSPVPAAESG